jgi:predicted enzyme related to lactoylglutathione lyase
MFGEDAARPGHIIWSPFKDDTKYFDPSDKPFMVNFRVDDLHALLGALRGAGVQVDERVEESEYGRFGWIMDPEGNRVELWQPPAPK